MKRLLLILILTFTFQILTKADDIRDFQIEGISIGDSLLDLMSEKEINKKSTDKFFYKNNEYYYHYFPSLNFLKTYDALQLTFKNNDPNYIIYSLQGVIRPINMNECFSKIKNIKNELNILFNKNAKFDQGNHSFFKSSTYERYYYNLDSGYVEIVCYDMSEKSKKTDSLYVIVDNKNFTKFLKEVQYK